MKYRSVNISIPEPIYFALRESGKDAGRSVEDMAKGIIIYAVVEIYKEAIKNVVSSQPDLRYWSKKHEN